MKHFMISFALVATAFAFSANAQTHMPIPSWTSVTGADCVSWNGGKEIRCLLNSKTQTPNVLITVKLQETYNDKIYAFTHEEYHSACGGSSKGPIQKQAHNDVSGQTYVVPLAAGSGITCREIFFSNCKVGTADTDCNSAIKVSWSSYKGNEQ